MSLTPFMKSCFTDLTGATTSHQWISKCGELEMKTLDCFDAYGVDRGLKKCEDLIDDFRECALRVNQMKRINAMDWERRRQYWAGERSKENLYAKAPPTDSY